MPLKLLKRRGVTLIELVMAITLIALLATGASYFVGGQIDNQRYEQTRAKLEKIRQSILGDSSLDLEGRRTNFGYMGDMGKFPDALTDLMAVGTQNAWVYDQTSGTGAGWRGPYYSVVFSGEDDIATDAWGTAFVYSTAGTITSYGANKVAGGTGYDSDLTMNLTTSPHRATVMGFVADGEIRLSNKSVQVSYPANGAFTTLSATTDTTGAFSLSNVPFGVRSFRVTTAPALGPKTVTVDKTHFAVPYETLNYHSSGGIVTNGLILFLDAANYTGSGWGGTGCGTLTWTDLTRAFGDATLTNFAGCDATEGWNGTGTQEDPYRLQFKSGDSTHLTITHRAIQRRNNVTFSLWIRVPASNNWRPLVVKETTGNTDRNYWFGLSSGAGGYGIEGGLVLLGSVGAVADIVKGRGATAIDDGVWRYIAGQMDGPSGAATLFVNGTQDGSDAYAGDPDPSTGTVYIGRDLSGRYNNSAIAAIAIYDRALTAAEHAQNCYALKPRFSGATCP